MSLAFARPVFLFALLIPVGVFIAGRYLGRPAVEKGVSTALRSTALVFLTLAFAGLGIEEPPLGSEVVFVVDRSASVLAADRDAAVAFVERAGAGMRAGDRAAVVSVAARAATELSVNGPVRGLELRADVGTDASRLEEGLLHALSSFESGGTKRIVLASDGLETEGELLNAVSLARAADVEVSVLPLGERSGSNTDIVVRGLSAPRRVRLNEPHVFSVRIFSPAEVNARVSVFRNDSFLGGEEIRLESGETVLSYTGELSSPGMHTYRVEVETDDDILFRNNVGTALVMVEGPPRFLLVSPEEESVEELAELIELQGIELERRPPAELPAEITELASYAGVIFADVPAYLLSQDAMRTIQRYVRDLGGGFLMLGGDESFGAGGYYDTPIEEVSPVAMDVTSSIRLPSLAMIFVIDKSGSMARTEASGASKLDLVKEAVLGAIDIMNPYYEVGLLAFDADTEWTIEPTDAGNRERITRDLAGLESGGGTIMAPALEVAAGRLRESPAAIKHLVVLSDGLASDADFEGSLESMAEDGITVSTVAVGGNSDRDLMRRISEWGRGRAYYAASAESIPRIFASETSIVSRDLIVEQTFFPSVEAESEILAGIDGDNLPPLDGFVLAYQKDEAERILSAVAGNPLLSTWRYGLGRATAFTSSFDTRWAGPWLAWDELPKLVAQMLRFTGRRGGETGLEPRLRLDGGRAILSVDALTPTGAFLNGLQLRAQISGPDSTEQVEPAQVGPGRYEAAFELRSEGVHTMTVVGQGLAPVTIGYARAYPPELDRSSPDLELLAAAARIGGGRVLSMDDTGELFARSEEAGTRVRELTALWLGLALAIFLIELALVYLVLPRLLKNPLDKLQDRRQLFSR